MGQGALAVPIPENWRMPTELLPARLAPTGAIQSILGVLPTMETAVVVPNLTLSAAARAPSAYQNSSSLER